jgi:hypothetical protein
MTDDKLLSIDIKTNKCVPLSGGWSNCCAAYGIAKRECYHRIAQKSLQQENLTCCKLLKKKLC